jgi:TetR/AcrR family transcriptional repressor of lmrAB and yxaGH operons
MRKRSDAKTQMVIAAARLFRQRGYEGVGVAELLEASGAPRGSLYFHFPGGKEEIGVEALRLAGEVVQGKLAALRARTSDPAGYVDAIFAGWAEELRDSNFQNGCAVAIIALEMAERSPALRDAAAAAFAAWEREFAEAAAGWGLKAPYTESFASAMLGAVEGAIALARTKRSEQPFADAATAMKALWRAMSAGQL